MPGLKIYRVCEEELDFISSFLECCGADSIKSRNDLCGKTFISKALFVNYFRHLEPTRKVVSVVWAFLLLLRQP
jgi:hypothetical protein